MPSHEWCPAGCGRTMRHTHKYWKHVDPSDQSTFPWKCTECKAQFASIESIKDAQRAMIKVMAQ